MSDPVRRATQLSVSYPERVFAIALIVAGLATPGVLSLSVETATESVLDKSSSSWLAYERFVQEFGSDEYVALLVRGREALDPNDLATVRGLTRDIAAIEGVDRVESLSTLPALLVGVDGSLITEPLLRSRGDGDTDLSGLLGRHRTAQNWVISSDRRAYGVNAIIESPVERHYPTVLPAIANAAATWGGVISGVPVFRAAADRRMRDDLSWYVPVTVGIIAALVFVLSGSVSAVLSALVAPALAVWVTMGVMGMSGVSLSITTIIIPPVVLALGCAYAMHQLLVLRDKHAGDVVEILSNVAKPVALSGVTTAIGFLGLATVRIEAINALGVFGAFAVAVLTCLTLTVTPALACSLGTEIRIRPWDQFVLKQAVRLWTASEKRANAVIALWGVAIAIGCFAVTQVKVSTNVIEWFDGEEAVRSNYEEIRHALAGISPLAIVLEPISAGARVTNAVMLQQMAEFLDYVRSLEGVGHAIGLSDLLGQLRYELGTASGDEIMSTAEAEQLLLLLEAEPMLNGLISSDRRSTALLVRLDSNDSDFIREFGGEAERWWREAEQGEFSATATGVMMEFARAQDEIVHGQVRGLSVALAAIALVVVSAFRSLRVASICMLVNLLPILIAIGCLWLFDVPLDAATAVIACLMLGIAVDDSLHLIYQRQLRVHSVGPRRAGVQALRVVARPVVFSTVALIAGFGLLGSSRFLPVAHLGSVTAGSMVICVLADLTLLPALLRRTGQ